tara:strand:- start:5 stop:580 length:576 start_codon:yes stop_codon:yes gene_type:complete
MFAFKKNYFLIIENTKNFDLRKIKKQNKFTIIYRNLYNKENISDIKKFRNLCKTKKIMFFIANDFNLLISTNSDGIYISASNKSFKSLYLNKTKFKIIGSAHNLKEIDLKKKQGCTKILFSKLFLVDYDKKAPFLGINRFNKYYHYISKRLVPLGGIKVSNLSSLTNLSCDSIAIYSAIKKKPANIINRLF